MVLLEIYVETPRKEIARAVRYIQNYKTSKEIMIMEYKKFNNQYVINLTKAEICAKIKRSQKKISNLHIFNEYQGNE